MTTKNGTKARTINGIDTAALETLVGGVAADSKRGIAGFSASTAWKGGTRSDSRITSWTLGGEKLAKDFTLRADEPTELLGGNTAPNPQEMVLSALNACMTVGYVAACTVKGIELRSLTITTQGQLDLRGFFGLDPAIRPGFATLHTTVTIDAAATEQEIREVHETVLKTSPNRWNLGQPIKLEADLIVASKGASYLE